jgi:hypothetical protein
MRALSSMRPNAPGPWRCEWGKIGPGGAERHREAAAKAALITLGMPGFFLEVEKKNGLECSTAELHRALPSSPARLLVHELTYCFPVKRVRRVLQLRTCERSDQQLSLSGCTISAIIIILAVER